MMLVMITGARLSNWKKSAIGPLNTRPNTASGTPNPVNPRTHFHTSTLTSPDRPSAASRAAKCAKAVRTASIGVATTSTTPSIEDNTPYSAGSSVRPITIWKRRLDTFATWVAAISRKLCRSNPSCRSALMSSASGE